MRLLELIGALIVAVTLAVGTYRVLMFLLNKAPLPLKEEPQCRDEPQQSKSNNEGAQT